MTQTTIVPLKNAAEAYPAMIKAITQAKHIILLAGYCIEAGESLNQFSVALLAAADRGVRIYVVMDCHGSKRVDLALVGQWKQAGVAVVWFRPFSWARPLRYNKRLHKKLLVIDDVVGFTGGIGIADMWLGGDIRYPKPWRDTHFELRGPVVGSMIAAFCQSWIKNSEIALEEHPGKSVENAQKLDSITTIDSVASHYPTLALAGSELLRIINEAKTSITITSAYFGPSRPIVNALQQAAERGVMIRILTNGQFGTHAMAVASGRSGYMRLLKKGIHIYEYKPTSIHAKIIVIDGAICQIGSANVNFRSFYHDEEYNLIVRDTKLIPILEQQFEADLEQSREVKLVEWSKRPLSQKVSQKAWSASRFLF